MTSATIDPARAAELLARQDALQAEAAEVIAALDLPALLTRAGRAEQIGSSVSGLMVWRDLDFNIVAPALGRDGLAEDLRPHGVRTLDDLDAYLRARGLPDRHAATRAAGSGEG